METTNNAQPVTINDEGKAKETNESNDSVPVSEPKSIPDNTTPIIETANEPNKQQNDVNNYSDIAPINNNNNENVQETIETTNNIEATHNTAGLDINESPIKQTLIEDSGGDIINELNGHKNDTISDNILNNDESNDSVQITGYKPPPTPIPKHGTENDNKNAQEDAMDSIHVKQIENTNTNNISATQSNHINDNNIVQLEENKTDTNQMEIDNESKNDNQIEIQTENNNNTNDFGIGTEHNNNNNNTQTNNNNPSNKHSDKEEMDIDEEPVHELTVKRKKKTPKKQTNSPNPKVAQNTTSLGTLEKPFGMMDYNEEEDEDFNEEEEEEDDGSSHSEQIMDDGDDESNRYSDLDDIDIVDDNKLYTEDAPRWLENPEQISDSDKEWDVANSYEQWEREKLNDSTEPRDNFFESLIKKYNKRDRCDPEKDKIKKDNYKLDDKFINDEDCFDDMTVETSVSGFHISVKHPKIKKINGRTPRKYQKKKKDKKDQKQPHSGKKEPKPKAEIPQTYKDEINKIREYMERNKDSLEYITNNREMNGIINGKQKYMKYMPVMEEKKDESDSEMVDERVKRVYNKLLMMVVELDTTILREKSHKKISEAVKEAIYYELGSIFKYDLSGSLSKLKFGFEELLNWFTYDWYDCKHEIQSKKINWRNLFLNVINNRAKARFHSKMNKKRKAENSENKKERLASKYEKSEIPWDGIAYDIFLMTCYTMELAAINEGDIDDARHQKQISLKDSISKYLVNGDADINIKDIEKIYKQQKNQPFPTTNQCYSYLIVQRIKEQMRANKKHKKSHTPKKHKRSKDNSKSVVDLTNNNNNNNHNHNNNNNRNIPTPPVLEPDMNDVITQTQEIEIKPKPQIQPQPQSQMPIAGGLLNGVIDLTDDTTTSNTVTASNTIHNTPKHSRKRRYEEMSQNDIATQQMSNELHSPPNKKTKLNDNNNHATYQSDDDFLTVGSMIGIQDEVGIERGVSIAWVEATDSQCVSYREYATNKTGKCAYTLCHRIVPYMSGGYDGILMNKVLALIPLDESNSVFEAKYIMAKVVEVRKPENMRNNINSMNNINNNDNCRIVVRYNEVERQLPLYTFIQSEKHENWRNNKIPTVIKIVPFIDNNSRHLGGKSPMNRSRMNSQMNSKDNSNSNNNNDDVIIIANEPPLSHIFNRTLPEDPWNDKHFAGGGD